MIQISVDVHSIKRIEEQAINAAASGKPVSANPYKTNSPAGRIWALKYDECKRQTATCGKAP